MASRTVWTGTENLTPTGIRSPDRPARNESLYRLRYPGPQINILISEELRYPATPFSPEMPDTTISAFLLFNFDLNNPP